MQTIRKQHNNNIEFINSIKETMKNHQTWSKLLDQGAGQELEPKVEFLCNCAKLCMVPQYSTAQNKRDDSKWTLECLNRLN
jgi:hypothetical protein